MWTRASLRSRWAAIGMSFQTSFKLMARSDAEAMARRAFASLLDDARTTRETAPADA